MVKNDIEELIEYCSITDPNNHDIINLVIPRILEKRNELNLIIEKLSLNIDKTTMQYQDLDLLKKDYYGRVWGNEKLEKIFLSILLLGDIIKINKDHTKFKLLVHDPFHILSHANKLVDVIGWDKLEEIKKYPLYQLEQFLNSHPQIKRAYEFDKQIWLGE